MRARVCVGLCVLLGTYTCVVSACVYVCVCVCNVFQHTLHLSNSHLDQEDGSHTFNCLYTCIYPYIHVHVLYMYLLYIHTCMYGCTVHFCVR